METLSATIRRVTIDPARGDAKLNTHSVSRVPCCFPTLQEFLI